MRYFRIVLTLLVICWGVLGSSDSSVWVIAQEVPATEHGTQDHQPQAHSDDGDRVDGDGAGHGEAGHAEAGHGGGGGDPNPVAVDPDLAIWTVVVFVGLLFVLNKFAWPTISAALVERELNIEENIASAAAKHEEAKQLLAQHEAKLAQASDEVRELLEEARRDAEHTKTQILEEAKQAADSERQRSLREVERATETAMQQLAETSANLAVGLASKVVRTHVTTEQQSELVREALAGLAKSSPSVN